MRQLDTWARSWARDVKTPDDVPQVFLEAYQSEITGFHGDNAPYFVVTPFERSGFIIIKPRLVCLYDGRIKIYEKAERGIISTSYNFKDIDYVEWRTVLLSSYIKINGISDNDTTSSKIDFNTSMRYLFKPVLEKIRSSIDKIIPAGDELFEAEKDKFNYLEKHNYKFMNYARDSLRPGAKVIDMVFQPFIKVKFMKFFTKTISASHLTVLTGKEMIIIREEIFRSKIDPYGGIWDYISLDKIRDISFTEGPEAGTLKLALSFSGNNTLNTIFTPDREEAFRHLIKSFRK
ncbi:MAG: hypothetical protein ABSG94_02405 [Brevinematales bacterium]|jgi:hypothetical protein